MRQREKYNTEEVWNLHLGSEGSPHWKGDIWEHLRGLKGLTLNCLRQDHPGWRHEQRGGPQCLDKMEDVAGEGSQRTQQKQMRRSSPWGQKNTRRVSGSQGKKRFQGETVQFFQYSSKPRSKKWDLAMSLVILTRSVSLWMWKWAPIGKSNWEITSRGNYFRESCFKWEQINKSWSVLSWSCYC